MHAFIQIATDDVDPDALCGKLREYKEIKDLYLLFGKWDVVAIAEIDDADTLGTFVVERIRKLPGVRDTATQIVAKKVIQ